MYKHSVLFYVISFVVLLIPCYFIGTLFLGVFFYLLSGCDGSNPSWAIALIASPFAAVILDILIIAILYAKTPAANVNELDKKDLKKYNKVKFGNYLFFFSVLYIVMERLVLGIIHSMFGVASFVKIVNGISLFLIPAMTYIFLKKNNNLIK